MAIVYQHVRLDTNNIFYIGIGLNNDASRAYVKKRSNVYWKNIVNKVEYRIDIIHDNIDYSLAKQIEIHLIAFHGRKDKNTGLLVNLTDGGDGIINMSHESEQKRLQSFYVTNQKPEVKRRRSKSLKLANAKPEVIKRRSESAKLALSVEGAMEYRVSQVKIANQKPDVIKRRSNAMKEVHSRPEVVQAKLLGHQKAVICTETLKIWESVKHCSSETKIPKSTLSQRLNGSRINRTTYMYKKIYDQYNNDIQNNDI